MVWLALFGIALQIGGLGLAIKGVADTYREFVGASIWPALARWFWHDILKRPRPPVHVTAHAQAALGATSSASATIRLPDVDNDMAVEAQIAALARSVRILEGRILMNREHFNSQHDRLKKETNKRLAAITDDLQRARSEIRALSRATVGPQGKGLVETLAGFLITVVGIGFTVAGLPF